MPRRRAGPRPTSCRSSCSTTPCSCRPSPVIKLHRAIAFGQVFGAAAALTEIDALASQLNGYHLYHATRAELLRDTGRAAQARAADEQAIELTRNPAERGAAGQPPGLSRGIHRHGCPVAAPSPPAGSVGGWSRCNVADVMTPARRTRDRALAWAEREPDVRAVVIFGSVAAGRDDELSDLDLILVAEPGRRDELWQRRMRIAEDVLAAPVVSTQEPTWQGEFRFQATTADLAALDLTITECTVDVFAGLARGYAVLLDRGDVSARLAEAVAGWHPPVFDAAATDPGTWSWFRYLHGRLRKGERFAVRAGLHDTLMYRVVPMLGAHWHCADRELSGAERRRVHVAMPRSSDDAELARALSDTAALYEWALDRWSERTGRPRPAHPLAPAIRALLDGAQPDRTT